MTDSYELCKLIDGVVKCYPTAVVELGTSYYTKLEFGMYPQSMPTEWTHARTLRPWQSVRLDL